MVGIRDDFNTHLRRWKDPRNIFVVDEKILYAIVLKIYLNLMDIILNQGRKATKIVDSLYRNQSSRLIYLIGHGFSI